MRFGMLLGTVATVALSASASAETEVPSWAVGKWVGKVSFSQGTKADRNRVLVINEKGECYFGYPSSNALEKEPDCVIGKDSITFGTSVGSSYVLKLNGEKLDGTAQYTKASRTYRLLLTKQ